MKTKKLRWKDVYSKSNHNKYSRITNISKEFTINSNYKNFFKSNGISIAIVLIILCALLFYTFRNNLMLVVYTTGFLILLFCIMLYHNTYKLKLKNDEIELNINFQKYEISYNNLINIYLSRETIRVVGFPVYAYSLCIIYSENQIPMLIQLPIVMLNKKSLLNFFECFETEIIESEEKEQIEAENSNKQVVRAILLTAAIVIVVALIVGFIIYSFNR